jgi:hypothetical protein
MKRVAPRFINLLATLGAFSLVAARGQQPQKGARGLRNHPPLAQDSIQLELFL